MFTNFMLPSTGAATLDGTIVIILAAIAVVAVLYRNKDNISLNSKDRVANTEENILNNVARERIVDVNKDKSAVLEDEDVLNDEEEKLKAYN